MYTDWSGCVFLDTFAQHFDAKFCQSHYNDYKPGLVTQLIGNFDATQKICVYFE